MVLRTLYPKINLTTFSSYFSALSAVEKGDLFAVFGESRILNHIVKSSSIYGIVENFIPLDLNVHTGSKIRKDWPILASIINKAQKSIPKSRLKLLSRKWLQPGLELSHLTLEQIKWLQEKPLINVNFYGVPPYLYSNKDKAEGFLVDYFALFEQMLGIKLKWNVVPFKQGNLNSDGSLPEAALTLSKDLFVDQYVFTRPFFNTSFGLFTRVDRAKITDLEALNNHVVGFLKGSQGDLRREYLTSYSGIGAKLFANFGVMIEDLMSQKIDSFYAETGVVRSYLSRNMIQVVGLNWLDTHNVIEQPIAFRKDLAPFADIFSKTETLINKRSLALVFEKWLVGDIQLGYQSSDKKESDSKLNYSVNEKNWIASHPIVYYSDVNWIPYVNVDNGTSGIGKDYLDIIAKKTGIVFNYVPAVNWNQVLEKLKNNEISLTIAAGKTKQRAEFAIFSNPYISSAMTIVTSEKFAYVQNLDQLKGLTIAIPEELFLADLIKESYPTIKLIFTDTIMQALSMVAANKADAFVGSMAVVASHLRKGELYNLRVSGQINRQLDVHFMIGKKHTKLQEIINKTLAKIGDVERRGIANRWFAVNYQTGFKSQTVWMILLIAVIIVSLSFYWIRRLKLEIMQKNLVEKALKSARTDAELANKAKSEFLANMSHEIRTPMNAIVGFSHLLSESELTDKQQAYLRSILVGSNGLLHIINDILDLSKIEAGKMQIEYESTDLINMLDELELLFFSGMKDKGISFSTNIDCNVPRFLMLDVNRVRQILLNLIGNAQKFTDFGQVGVRVYVSEVNENTDSVNLCVEVSDSGIGIAPDSLQRVFRHFEQHEKSKRHQYGGTGLGLAISRKLAEKMNGQLTAISELGKGSCFTLRLDHVEITERSSVIPEERHSFDFDKSVILVVDDIESNRILLTKYLEDYPFEIFIAENGKEAVELAKKTNPNLILMDIRMPEMDGYEATRLIKSQQQTVVVALTASALEDEESKQKQRVFDAFLRKPILKSKLISVMAEFLSHQNQVFNTINTTPHQVALSKQHPVFNRYIKDEFLSKIEAEHKRGDVEKIEQLACTLKQKSQKTNNLGLTKFAEELTLACEAFDVEKIDNLINLLFLELKDSK